MMPNRREFAVPCLQCRKPTFTISSICVQCQRLADGKGGRRKKFPMFQNRTLKK